MYCVRSAFARNGRKIVPTRSSDALATAIPLSVHESQIYDGYDQEELAIFDRFRPAPTVAGDGFVTDFLNVRTRVSFFQDELERSLDHAIPDRGNRQDADFLAPFLRYLLLPCSHGPIRMGD